MGKSENNPFAVMQEIREILINYYNGSDDFSKERIKILLKNEQVTRVMCPECGNKFVPGEHEESVKSGIVMYHPPGEYASHSPTEPEFDTLQEGDWFQGTDQEYWNALKVYDDQFALKLIDVMHKQVLQAGFIAFCYKSYEWDELTEKKTQLTPEEFIRRAENTFKTK